MAFKVKVDIAGARAAIRDLSERQLPFTVARALTLTAQDAQKAVRFKLPNIFKLRNQWTSTGIRITPATKTSLVAEVRTDTSNRTTGAPDYLPRQDYGGEKVPIAGRNHIAVPTKYLDMMRNPNAPIPDFLRPKALLAYADQQGKYKTRRGISRSQPSTIRGMVFFLTKLRNGDYAIMGRYVTDRDAYPMYLLIPEAQIRARFPMEQIVESAVQANFAQNFRKAAAETMSNDLLRGSGVRFKL